MTRIQLQIKDDSTPIEPSLQIDDEDDEEISQSLRSSESS